MSTIQPNHSKIQKDLNQCLMLVTALTPKIGYEKASEIAKHAHKENLNLRQAAIQLGYISEEDYDNIVNPLSMTTPSN